VATRREHGPSITGTAFVATKISFINEIASLCEHVARRMRSAPFISPLDSTRNCSTLPATGRRHGGIFAEDRHGVAERLARENG